MNLALILSLPLLGTTLGAAMVFFLKNQLSKKMSGILMGFAAGVMIAASVWSLLIPAIEMAQDQGVIGWLPAAAGFMLGIFFLLALDHLIPHFHIEGGFSEGPESSLKKTTKMLLAVTLHNIPEGMAVGVTLSAAATGDSPLTAAAALSLAIGIAIQNFPEGAIVSMPLYAEGESKWKAFFHGFLSGAVEPIASVITMMFVAALSAWMPYFLSFAAGAMMYVVVEELIPESQAGSHTNMATIAASVGFVLMMILDVALG